MSVFILSLFYFIWLIVEIEYIWFFVIFCIGNVGNVLDGYNFLIKSIFFSDDSDFDEETVDDVFFLNEVAVETFKWKSIIFVLRLFIKDKIYYYFLYYEDKSCVYIKYVIEDYRRRMYNFNIVDRIIEKLVCYRKY